MTEPSIPIPFFADGVLGIQPYPWQCRISPQLRGGPPDRGGGRQANLPADVAGTDYPQREGSVAGGSDSVLRQGLSPHCCRDKEGAFRLRGVLSWPSPEPLLARPCHP
jgi:hypothetical protein